MRLIGVALVAFVKKRRTRCDNFAQIRGSRPQP
jgi:hypothetical protein